jgi:coenzyme F420-reducing hydrogenase delta subunit
MLLRGGVAGVVVFACPPRDCLNREGPRWLVERIYHEREAELQARVDRARVRVVHVNAGEHHAAVSAFQRFALDLSALAAPAVDRAVAVDAVCEAATTGVHA